MSLSRRLLEVAFWGFQLITWLMASGGLLIDLVRDSLMVWRSSWGLFMEFPDMEKEGPGMLRF